MKTPMQEHIQWLKERYKMLMEYKDGTALEIGDCIEHAELMLEKEKEAIINAANNGCKGLCNIDTSRDGENYYNEVYNNIEK